MKIETLAKNQTVVVEGGTASKYIYRFIGLNRKGITDAIKNGIITVEEI